MYSARSCPGFQRSCASATVQDTNSALPIQGFGRTQCTGAGYISWKGWTSGKATRMEGQGYRMIFRKSEYDTKYVIRSIDC